MGLQEEGRGGKFWNVSKEHCEVTSQKSEKIGNIIKNHNFKMLGTDQTCKKLRSINSRKSTKPW